MIGVTRRRGLRPRGGRCRTDWGYPMTTQLLIVILSIVALHLAAFIGGGLALGVMKLFGREPPSLPSGDVADTAH